MESCVLNDVEYDFKPLEIFVTDPDYLLSGECY